METKIPIADRITYEAWGTEANPHSPLWGIEILKKKGEGMSGLIIKPEELSKLKNLERNSTLETLATR
ncbi:MAG: hypothetical protein NZM26_02605, partial [Patescibacteria group bacterium]|nr:hypothetical protein [Patescibacteria group bacterium]